MKYGKKEKMGEENKTLREEKKLWKRRVVGKNTKDNTKKWKKVEKKKHNNVKGTV